MDRIAQAPQEERAELFRRSAAVLRPERSPEIIEKDFWVCWSLRRIYEVLRFRPWEQIMQGLQELEEQINGG